MAGLKKVKTSVREEVEKIQREARERTLGYITGAFGVIAGLAWNDFVKALIENIFPAEENSTLWAKLAYAGIMTGVVVGVTVYLSGILKEKDKNNEKKSTGEEVVK